MSDEGLDLWRSLHCIEKGGGACNAPHDCPRAVAAAYRKAEAENATLRASLTEAREKAFAEAIAEVEVEAERTCFLDADALKNWEPIKRVREQLRREIVKALVARSGSPSPQATPPDEPCGTCDGGSLTCPACHPEPEPQATAGKECPCATNAPGSCPVHEP